MLRRAEYRGTATWHKLEDGVLWEARPEGVIAVDVAPRSTAMAAGIRTGRPADRH